jgi:hypothetical protein
LYFLKPFSYDLLSGNTVNGHSIVYLENINDIIINQQVGQIIIQNCHNISISNCTVSNVYGSIQLFDSNNINISYNEFNNTWEGIVYNNVNFSHLSNNHFINSSLLMKKCNHNIVNQNIFTFDIIEYIYDYVLILDDSAYISIFNNVIKSEKCIQLKGFSNNNSIYQNSFTITGFRGITLDDSGSNSIYENFFKAISNDNSGILIFSRENEIYNNHILDCSYSIILARHAINNFIFQNNFLNYSEYSIYRVEEIETGPIEYIFSQLFFVFSRNHVNQNYYDTPNILTMSIYGELYLHTRFFSTKINIIYGFDWFPAKEPFDITHTRVLL